MSTIIPIADNGQVFLPKEIIKGFKKPLIVFEESDENYFFIISEEKLKQNNDQIRFNFDNTIFIKKNKKKFNNDSDIMKMAGKYVIPESKKNISLDQAKDIAMIEHYKKKYDKNN